MTEQSGTAGTADSQADAAIAWAEKRGLSRETLAALGVTRATDFFPGSKKKSTALRFHYPTGYKARSIEGKDFVAGGGFKSAFWNIERVLEANPDVVYITEGELDACALVEAGVPAGAVLSVPNGAHDKPSDNPRAHRGYDYVQEALASGLKRVKRVIWCGDLDDPGRALRSDMVQLFGAARFWFVDWPNGAKDAGDVLRIYGQGPLFDALQMAQIWPVAGLYDMDQIPDPPPFEQWHPGFPEWQNKIFLAPRTLSVVTGHPGHGKTVLWQQIWFQIMQQHDLVACMASFETRAKPHIRRQIRTLHSGFLEREMTDEQKAAADAWIRDRYKFVIHDANRPTIEWFLDLAEVAVIRHGARIIQVDPWNRFEHEREDRQTETEYIGRVLKEMHTFANQFNCHVQILAHPAKMEGKHRGHAPSLEDISGSKHWHNMSDQGFIVHRPKMFEGGQRRTEAVLYHSKARFEELGYPCQLGLDYVLAKGAYVSRVEENPKQRGEDK